MTPHSSYPPIYQTTGVISDIGTFDHYPTSQLSSWTSAAAVSSTGPLRWPFNGNGCAKSSVNVSMVVVGGDIVAPVLLDLPAAFDIWSLTRHSAGTVICRTFGIVDRAHRWFRSSLTVRIQEVGHDDVTSHLRLLLFIVASLKGSVLGVDPASPPHSRSAISHKRH